MYQTKPKQCGFIQSTSSMPGSSKWSIYLRFPQQNPVCTSPFPNRCYIPRPSHYCRFNHPNNIWWGLQIIKLLVLSFLHSTVTSPLLGQSIPLSTLFSNSLSLRPSLNVSDQVSRQYKTTYKIIVLYIFIFLDSKLEGERFCTEW
jgi:hypothetical protein